MDVPPVIQPLGSSMAIVEYIYEDELMSIALLLYYLAHESGAGRCSKGRARDGSLQESRVGTLELLYKL